MKLNFETRPNIQHAEAEAELVPEAEGFVKLCAIAAVLQSNRSEENGVKVGYA